MKLPSLLVAAAVAVATVSATECTDDQFTALEKASGPALEKACPSLMTESGSAIDPTHADSLTADDLKSLSSCKDAACITALKDVVKAVPDCTALGINVKSLYSASVTLCEGFGAGTMTVDKAKEIFKDVAKNLTNSLEDIMTDGSKNPFEGMFGGGSKDSDKPTITTKKPSNGSSADTPTTAPAGASKSPSSTPASASPVPTTTKSAANTMTVAGVAVVTTVVATMLL